MSKQIENLLQAIHDKYGYDFFNYKRESIIRRIRSFMDLVSIPHVNEFQNRVLEDSELFVQLVRRITISVTSMFRDPKVFLFLRNNVFPILATYPHIRIWSVGTGTGEEAYSLAIILKEENLYHRALIYATDINPIVLEKAHNGRYSLDRIAKYTKNYIAAGGKEAFSKYYTTTSRYANIILELKQNIVFATHNLTHDSMFNEFQLIVCRNVLIYFNKELTNNVFKLFNKSLCERGYLCLGSAEDLRFHSVERYFQCMDQEAKVYRKH